MFNELGLGIILSGLLGSHKSRVNFKEIAMLLKDKMWFKSERYTPYDFENNIIRVWIDGPAFFVLEFRLDEDDIPIEFIRGYIEPFAAITCRGIQWEPMDFVLRTHSNFFRKHAEEKLNTQFNDWTLQDCREDIVSGDHYIVRASVDMTYVYMKVSTSIIYTFIDARFDDLF